MVVMGQELMAITGGMEAVEDIVDEVVGVGEVRGTIGTGGAGGNLMGVGLQLGLTSLLLLPRRGHQDSLVATGLVVTILIVSGGMAMLHDAIPGSARLSGRGPRTIISVQMMTNLCGLTSQEQTLEEHPRNQDHPFLRQGLPARRRMRTIWQWILSLSGSIDLQSGGMDQHTIDHLCRRLLDLRFRTTTTPMILNP